MAFHIRDEETDRMVRELAERTGAGLTETVREAVRAQLRQTSLQPSFDERLKAIQDEVASWGDSGMPADKAFYDSLNDEGE